MDADSLVDTLLQKKTPTDTQVRVQPTQQGQAACHQKRDIAIATQKVGSILHTGKPLFRQWMTDQHMYAHCAVELHAQDKLDK
jgi:hypothetical protein